MKRFILILILLLLITPLAYPQMQLDKAVIHHTDSHDVSVKEIDKWHRQRGWDCIGYHFVIRKNGSIEKGRPLWKKGAHAKGRNEYIGIALTGYNNFTNKQITSLKRLLIKYNIKHIENHHQNCPGKGLNLDKIANDLQIEFKEIK